MKLIDIIGIVITVITVISSILTYHMFISSRIERRETDEIRGMIREMYSAYLNSKYAKLY